jgi:hypothetical protein
MATEVKQLSDATRSLLKLVDDRVAFWEQSFMLPTGAGVRDEAALHEQLAAARKDVLNGKYELEAAKKLEKGVNAATKRFQKLTSLEQKASKQANKAAIGDEPELTSQQCVVDGKPATQQCCQECTVPYCSSACKKTHWLNAKDAHWKTCASRKDGLPVTYQNKVYTLP